MPQGGHAGLAEAVCLPDFRWRLPGLDHIGLSGARAHGVPFTVYLPTAFPDGLGEAWWLGLEEVIAREKRVSLVMDRKERHFNIASTSEKYQLYNFLGGWMRSLPPPELSSAINDLCKRYSVDLAALSREASMDWADLAKLAADPLVTIGSATVNYPVLST